MIGGNGRSSRETHLEGGRFPWVTDAQPDRTLATHRFSNAPADRQADQREAAGWRCRRLGPAQTAPRLGEQSQPASVARVSAFFFDSPFLETWLAGYRRCVHFDNADWCGHHGQPGSIITRMASSRFQVLVGVLPIRLAAAVEEIDSLEWLIRQLPTAIGTAMPQRCAWTCRSYS